MTSQDTEIIRLQTIIERLRWSHFGVLTAEALRMEVEKIDGPRDILAVDVRKVNAMNSALGYNRTTGLVAKLVPHLAGKGRRTDQVGQYLEGQYGSGDEFIYVVPVGDGLGMMKRILRRAARLTRRLTFAERLLLYTKTGGIVNGINLACVLVRGSTNILDDMARAIDGTTILKAGKDTGDRDTSGAKGTRVGEISAS